MNDSNNATGNLGAMVSICFLKVSDIDWNHAATFVGILAGVTAIAANLAKLRETFKNKKP